MLIDKYFTETDQGTLFTRQQACEFAKKVANDFNPLHDADAKRFCVPGDLLFSVILAKAGLHEKMEFTFSGMVSDNIALTFPTVLEEHFAIVDNNQKEYLDVKTSGKKTKNEALINALTQAYVSFSGYTFPHILVELMKANNVMINPTRPMVMYQSMSIELHDLNASTIELVLSKTTLTHDGKRGNACLAFNLLSNGNVIGSGEKHMMLSGLRPYCEEGIGGLINEYEKVKAAYNA